MRSALLCTSALALFVGTSNAAVVTVNTAQHPNGASSELNINISVLGLQNITLNNLTITGNAPVDYLLDPSSTGTIEALPGGALSLADVNQAFAGLFLTGSIQTVGVGAELLLGPVNVTNRNFTIDNTTPGGLSLNSGTLVLTITGGALAGTVTGLLSTNVVNVNLGTDPVSVDFADIGTSTVAGTADGNGTGLDPDGAELNIPLTFSTSLDLSGVALDVTTTGNLFLGSDVFAPPIPEFGSVGLLSLATVGMGGIVAARRRRKA